MHYEKGAVLVLRSMHDVEQVVQLALNEVSAVKKALQTHTRRLSDDGMNYFPLHLNLFVVRTLRSHPTRLDPRPVGTKQ